MCLFARATSLMRWAHNFRHDHCLGRLDLAQWQGPQPWCTVDGASPTAVLLHLIIPRIAFLEVIWALQSNSTELVAGTPRSTLGVQPRHSHSLSALQDGSGKVVGARVRDNMTGKEQDVYARVVLNATGPFADEIR